MNPIVYFLKTPSKYRRDAIVMSVSLLTLVFTPVIMMVSKYTPTSAVAVFHQSMATVVPVQSDPAPAQTAAVTTPANPAEVVWPAKGAVTAEYGGVGHEYTGFHTGIDIAGPNRQTVVAFKSGTVMKTGALTIGCGQCVFIDHGNGLESHYSHLSSILVRPGQQVVAGTPIGLEGTTGWSTGPHVHFAIQMNGQSMNPRKFVPGNPTP